MADHLRLSFSTSCAYACAHTAVLKLMLPSQFLPQVETMMVVITNDKKEADETKRVVQQQEADANAQADKAKAIAADAQRDLDAALPALEKAVESLKNLSRCV